MTATLCLLAFGAVMVYSASSPIGVLKGHGYGTSQFVRYLIFGAGGLAAMHVLERRGLALLNPRLVNLMLVGSFGLLLLVMVPGFGVRVYGARRWFSAGPIQFQPSEVMKLALVLYVARYLADHPKRITRRFSEALAPIGVVAGPALLLIVVEPDLGTALVVAFAIIALLVAAGLPRRHFGMLIALGAGLVGLLILAEPYQQARLLAFLHPWSSAGNSGYQAVQGQIALGSGGLLGVGLGHSVQKAFYLPEAQNDFILAVIGEELGVLGIFGVVCLYGMIAYAGLRAARRAADRYAKLLATGLTSLILCQGILNIFVVLGLVPLTGVPLPFISYAPTNLCVMLASVGLLLNIARPGARQLRAVDGRARRSHRSRPDVTAPRIVIGAGGTAGHVVPALAVADALRAEGAEVTFIGGERAELELVPAAGYELHGLRVVSLPRDAPLKAARAAVIDAAAGRKARRLLRQLRAAGCARRRRLRCRAGRARGGARPDSTRADGGRQPSWSDQSSACAAGAPGVPRVSDRRARVEPLPRHRATRPGAGDAIARRRDKRFGIAPDETCVLVFGGSQGARSINHAAIEAFAGARFHVLHAAGERDLPDLQSPGPHYDLRGYISDFGEALIASDLVIARSGGSVFEIAAHGRPAILIPYPHATADHQASNARFMEQAGAAIVIPDSELTGAAAGPGGRPALLADGGRLAAMARASARDRPDRRGRGDRTRGARGGTEALSGSRWVPSALAQYGSLANPGPSRALACAARSIARAGQNVPDGGPPRQVPLLLPGTCVHMNASARGKPVTVVRRGPRPRPGGLQRSSLP